jgi:hypothetical protein
MAKRVHRRRNAKGHFIKGGSHTNPPRKRSHAKRGRKAVAVMHSNSHHRLRRHHHRNPDMISIVGSAAAKGLGVVGGQVLARKVRGGLQGVLTTNVNVSTGLPGLATTLGAAVLGALAHAHFTPAKHRGIGDAVVVGMFAEAINFGLALTPAAPYLSAYAPRPIVRVVPTNRRLAAYPRGALPASNSASATRFGAYARSMGGAPGAGMGGTGY